ncbi:MAG TPA: S8 family serine peptidase [Candidatus Kapabacteria bacterium]|nr:S8 family serine peptidase [Candidatus Kapabacteria bacterium]
MHRWKSGIAALFAIAILIHVTASHPLLGQSIAPLMNDVGDTVLQTGPVPDSMYVHNRVILKFRPGVLNTSILCFTVPAATNPDEQHEIDMQGMPGAFKTAVMAQSFPIDSGIIADTALRSALRALGGSHLRRITSANPCLDTFTVTRNGDTIPADDYNWMVLELNNDTNALNAVNVLPEVYSQQVEMAGLDLFRTTHRIPNDLGYQLQGSFWRRYTGIESAWDYQTGNSAIKVGIIDDGLDYRHCDLGAGVGLGHKVTGGWNYGSHSPQFCIGGRHGTQVAGIIGALTDNSFVSGCDGVAGIGGGWEYGAAGGSPGLQLLGFGISNAVTGQLDVAMEIGALREASARGPNYGYGVHIVNMSIGGSTYSEAERSAVDYAVENGVSVVCSRGNNGDPAATYPACYDQSWVVNVGGATSDFHRSDNKQLHSSYGAGMDLLAPGNALTVENDSYIRTPIYTGDNGGLGDLYDFFSGTSAAAPHVAGTIGLLRSDAADNAWASWWNQLRPEDYEGMVKASCWDLNGQTVQGSGYVVGYDPQTGWGHLKADTLFDMIHGNEYRCQHYSTDQVTYSSWTTMGLFWFGRNVNDPFHPIRPGLYSVQRRVVSGVIWIDPDVWDIWSPLYTWGIGGYNGTLSAAHPNYQTTYTEVTNANGGNGLVPGLSHNSALGINVRGYQYKATGVWSWMTPLGTQIVPANPRLYVSVFGRPVPPMKTAGVGQDEAAGGISSLAMNVAPNPAADVATVRYLVPHGCTVRITLYDALGHDRFHTTIEHTAAGANTVAVPVGGLPGGLYLCHVTDGSQSVSAPVIVAR